MSTMADTHGHYLRSRFALLTEEDLASLLNLSSTGTLATWRAENKGPIYCRLGKSVFYRGQDVEAWIFDQRVKL